MTSSKLGRLGLSIYWSPVGCPLLPNALAYSCRKKVAVPAGQSLLPALISLPFFSKSCSCRPANQSWFAENKTELICSFREKCGSEQLPKSPQSFFVGQRVALVGDALKKSDNFFSLSLLRWCCDFRSNKAIGRSKLTNWKTQGAVVHSSHAEGQCTRDN